MKIKNRKRKGDEREYARLVAQETLIFDVTEEIARALDQEAITRSDLADRLGKSKGFITQLLSGERNMTLRTAADLAFALGRRFDVRALPARPLVRPEQPYHGHEIAERHSRYREIASAGGLYGGGRVEPARGTQTESDREGIGPDETIDVDQESEIRAEHEFALAA